MTADVDSGCRWRRCQTGAIARDLYHGVTEQAKAAGHRREDAKALFDAGRWRGSMYLAGYAVECLLKTKLMRRFDCLNLQELEEDLQRHGLLARRATIFTHQLYDLLRLTGGADRLRNNEVAWRSFTLVNQWMPAWRYRAHQSNVEDAGAFLEAVDGVLRWVEHNI